MLTHPNSPPLEPTVETVVSHYHTNPTFISIIGGFFLTPIMGKAQEIIKMSVKQVRNFGHATNMQSTLRPYDFIRKMASLTDDMILHVASEIFTQFPHDSDEVFQMGIELSKRGLGGKISQLKSGATRLPS